MIRTYWQKKLTAQHEHRAAQINEIRAEDSRSDWITQDRTPPIVKGPFKHAVQSSLIETNRKTYVGTKVKSIFMTPKLN